MAADSMRPPVPMQLDIFEDSRDVMLHNDLITALQAQDARAAERALRNLAGEFADHKALDDGRVLVAALLAAQAQPAAQPFASIEEAAKAARELGDGLAASAERLLPRGVAAGWLAPHWARLARRAERVPYAKDDSGAMAAGHAAALWLRAGDWKAAAQAVEGIESWRRIPLPLAWMTEAHHLESGLDATWSLWVELAWLAPRRFAELAARIADRPLAKLLQRFGRDFDAGVGIDADSHWAWFPAWCLVDSPSLAAVMDGATTSATSATGEPVRACSLLQSLLRLERQGRHHEIVKAREALRQCHGGLFDLYMSTR